MPNAKVLSEKQAVVASLTETLKTASSGVLVDYRGITVAEDTALRVEPMRVINKFAKQFNGAKFVIKGGFMDGKVIPLEDIMALAELPSKEGLQAMVLGTMLAPITSLALVLKAIAEEKGGFVEAPAAEEAPVAE